MSQATDFLNKLPVMDPRTILRGLTEYAEKFSLWDVDKFEVTILLQSGHVVSGKAARLGRDLDGDCVLLYQGEQNNPTLVYLRLSDVIAVRLNNPAVAARVFSERERKIHTGQVPTRLQIKRDLETVNQKLQASGKKLPAISCVWDSVGETSEEQYNLSEMTVELPKTIQTISEEALGAQALSSITSVVFRSTPGSSLSVFRNGTTLDISYDLRRALPDSLDTALKAAIEKSL